MVVKGKFKEMVSPGEFILDGVMKEIRQLDEESAKEANSEIAKGFKYLKSVVCNRCDTRTATVLFNDMEYLCTTCKSKEDFDL